MERRISLLKEAVQAVHEEIHQASDYYEAWRPTVHDAEVGERMGTSYATNTYEVIRQALRREMVLALMRVWDTNKQAVRLSLVGSELKDREVVEALAAEYGSLFLQGQPKLGRFSAEDTLEERAALAEAVRGYREREAADFVERSTREPIREALQIIARYQAGGSGLDILKHLTHIRHTRLAHRQLVSPSPSPIADIAERTDEMFQDMLRLTHLLRLGVQGIHYEPDATAKIQASYARLFWRGVRGERTEGHPDYLPPRVRRTPEQVPSETPE